MLASKSEMCSIGILLNEKETKCNKKVGKKWKNIDKLSNLTKDQQDLLIFRTNLNPSNINYTTSLHLPKRPSTVTRILLTFTCL